MFIDLARRGLLIAYIYMMKLILKVMVCVMIYVKAVLWVIILNG